MRAIRTQADSKGDAVSAATALVFHNDDTNHRSRTRQEFKDETDTNWILKRFGIQGANRQVQYGHADFDLDLQQAHEAVNAAKIAHHRMPAHLRDKYPTYKSLLNAIESGELTSLEEVAPAPIPKEGSDAGDAAGGTG